MTSQADARRAAEAFLDVEVRARFPHEVAIGSAGTRPPGDDSPEAG